MEVQDRFPPVAIPLGEVGVVGVRVPLNFEDYKGKRIVVVPRFEAFVDLPAWRKGVHASRQYETIVEVFNQFAGKAYKLERVCAEIAVEILRRQNEATRAKVKAVGDAILEKTTPVSRHRSYEPYRLIASAVATKKTGGKVEIVRKVGVGVKGVTACPCAQELMAARVKNKLLEIGFGGSDVEKILRVTPVATHMQRSLGVLVMEVPKDLEIDAFKLAEIVEESMSAPSYGLLKREDEIEIVYRAAERTLFAEDAVRIMMKKFVERFPSLPDNIRILFKVRSQESIHKHDFMAKKTISFGALKAEVEGNNKYDGGSR
ncbi:MAG: GTP cyclohydrolase MptA [Candidatus Hecatellaceae archaeon]